MSISPFLFAGIKEAKDAGELLRSKGYSFDYVFTSELSRAKDTAKIIIEQLGQNPAQLITSSWQLNERHYGALTGYSKEAMIQKYGPDQVKKKAINSCSWL